MNLVALSLLAGMMAAAVGGVLAGFGYPWFGFPVLIIGIVCIILGVQMDCREDV